MAMIQNINIHSADIVKAEAKQSDGTSWLTLRVGNTWPAEVALFMDFGLAQIYANAINGANTQHQQLLDDEAEFQAELQRQRKEEDYADEHRQRVHEVL